MTQVLNFILKHQPPTWPEFEEICPDGGVIPDCDIRVVPDYWGVPPPTETYGNLEVINCPMESLTAKCGASVSVWMRPGCPDDTPDVVCDTVQNPTDIDPNSSETIYILDGYPPYVWEIVGGHGFSLEWESTGDLGGRPDERLNSRNILYASPESCGTARVKIKDNCATEIVCEFSCEQLPVLEYDWDNSASIVARSSSAVVFVTGGSPPYTWDVSGSGFGIQSLETYGKQNTIYADAAACGSGTITVEDVCGVIVEGFIRCSSGYWVQLPVSLQEAKNYVSMDVGYCVSYHYMLGTQGKYKVEEQFSVCQTYSYCDDPQCSGTSWPPTGPFDPYSCLQNKFYNTPIDCMTHRALPGCGGIGGKTKVGDCCKSDGSGVIDRMVTTTRVVWEWKC